jgi:DNA polymerase epsilon subunit 1
VKKWFQNLLFQKLNVYRYVPDLFGALADKNPNMAMLDDNTGNNADGGGDRTPGKGRAGADDGGDVDMEDAGGAGRRGSLIGKAAGPRVRRFFRGAAEDSAPGGAGCPATPEGAARGSRLPGSGPSPNNAGSNGGGGGGGGGGNGGGGQVRRRGAANDPVDLARDALESLGEEPDREEDYSGWLQHQKAKWKLGRAQRKRRRVEVGGGCASYESS